MKENTKCLLERLQEMKEHSAIDACAEALRAAVADGLSKEETDPLVEFFLKTLLEGVPVYAPILDNGDYAITEGKWMIVFLRKEDALGTYFEHEIQPFPFPLLCYILKGIPCEKFGLYTEEAGTPLVFYVNDILAQY